MKKIVCDYCGEKCVSIPEFVLPRKLVWVARSSKGVVLTKIGTSEIKPCKEDICQDCQAKIAEFLDSLVKRR